MAFVDADNPVSYLVAAIIKYTQLLFIKGLDDPVLSLKLVIQGKDLKGIQLFSDRLEFLSQVLELNFDSATDGLFEGVLVLGYFQIAFQGFLPIRSGLLPSPLFLMRFINNLPGPVE